MTANVRAIWPDADAETNPSAPENDSGNVAPERRVVLVSEDELRTIEPPTWRVQDVLPDGALALLFGDSETFKSFLALDVALHIATGRVWHRQHATRPGPVVYVAAEGFFGLRRRYEAWTAHYDVHAAVGIHFVRHAIEVRHGSDDLRDLRAEIAEKIGGPVALIVLDTLNRNLTGNENASDDMGAYLRGCDELRHATGAAVLSIHHTGHVEAERGRGHSSLRAALDVEMKVTRDGDRVTVECTKQKDAAHFAPLAFDMTRSGPSLVPKAAWHSDVQMTPNRATALRVLPTENGLTRSGWERASELNRGSFRHVRDWCVTMAYARVVHGGRYVRTEAGSAALAAVVPSSATGVPPANRDSATHRGGI